jgi:undecaprenyl-diphosphatase
LSRKALRRLDARWTARLRALSIGRAGRLLLSVAAHSGDSLVLVPLLALLWWREGFDWQGLAVLLAAAYALTVLFTTIVKYAVRRKRPAGEWGALYRKTDPHSFPSGHASRTLALTVVLLARGQLWPGLAAVAWTLLVGFARVVLGVHYLLDVLAGYLLGLGVGAFAALWAAVGLPW